MGAGNLMAATSYVFELEGWPRATVTKNGSTLSAVIDDIEDLDPQRAPSIDETTRGISSLNPPSVSTDEDVDTFVALCGEAAVASIRSTVGALTVPDEAVIRHKVTVAVCDALDNLGVAV